MVLKFQKNKPKYIIQVTAHFQIQIQGGIVAANGITGIFMVQAVVGASLADKVKRDSDKSNGSDLGRKRENSLFAQILEEKEEEQKAAMNCHTVTYGRDCRIRTFQYQPIEYHF